MNRTEALKEIRDIYKEHFDDYDPQTNMIAAIIEEALQSEPETGKSLRDELQKAQAGLLAVQTLIDESSGVSGLHLNGDDAPWESLLAGGHFEAWLVEFSIAIDAMVEPA